MKREDCINKNIDAHVFDTISERFGTASAEALDPKEVEAIRVEAFTRMSNQILHTGPQEGLFEQHIENTYKSFKGN